MDWVNLFALAVNEENAGRRAHRDRPDQRRRGVLPAVLHYYVRFCAGTPADR